VVRSTYHKATDYQVFYIFLILGPLRPKYIPHHNIFDYPQSVVQIKVKFSLSTPWIRTGGEEVQFHSLLASVLDGGEWSTSFFGWFTPGEKSGTHWAQSICFPVGEQWFGSNPRQAYPQHGKCDHFYLLFDHVERANIYLCSLNSTPLEEWHANSPASSSSGSYSIRQKKQAILSSFAGFQIPQSQAYDLITEMRPVWLFSALIFAGVFILPPPPPQKTN
jgi:hypothetical protein